MKSARNRIEERRLSLNKSDRQTIQDRIDRRDEYADSLKQKVIALEAPLDEAIKADEARREAERLAREQAEAERVARINIRIDEIRQQATDATEKTSAEILQLGINLKALKLTDEVFQELLPNAQLAKEQALAALGTLYSRTKASEDQAERLRLAEEELERTRKAEAERKKAEDAERAAEQARLAEENRKRQAELDARDAELRKRETEANERQRKADQEAADRRAAADREAAEKREHEATVSRAKQAALDKIQEMHRWLTEVADGEVEDIECVIDRYKEVNCADEFPGDLFDLAQKAKEAAISSAIRLLQAKLEVRERVRAEAEAQAQREREAEAAFAKKRKEEEARAKMHKKLIALEPRIRILLNTLAGDASSAMQQDALSILRALG
jgi:hypothetical protein